MRWRECSAPPSLDTEGVLDEGEVPAPLLRIHRQHVEAARRLGAAQGEVQRRRARHAAPLARADCRQGRPEQRLRARLDFDEAEHVAVLGDEVDLTPDVTVVALDDTVALALEPGRGGLFGHAAAADGVRLGAELLQPGHESRTATAFSTRRPNAP